MDDGSGTTPPAGSGAAPPGSGVVPPGAAPPGSGAGVPSPGVGFGAVLALAMGIGPLALYAISAMGPLIIEDLGLSRVQLGACATVAFSAAAVSSALVGRAADVFSARRVMLVLFLGAGGALLAMGVAASYLWLLAAVAVSGAVQALSNPVTNQLVSANVPAGRRGVMMGVKQSGVQMSQLGAGLLLPGLGLLLGWRGAAAAAASVAVLGLALLRRGVPAGRPTAAGTAPRPRRRLPTAVWWLTGYALLTGAGLQAMNVYMPLFGYEVLHLPVTTAGLAPAVVGGVGLAARIFWGRSVDRVRRPYRPLALLAAVSAGAALSVLASGLVGTPWLLWLGAVLFGASGIAANVVVMVAMVQVAELSVVGAASGVIAVGLYLGFASGPIVFGTVVDHLGAYQVGWLSVAAGYAAAAGLALLWRGRNGAAHSPHHTVHQEGHAC